MTDIQQLILAARPMIPFRGTHDAQKFLDSWPLEDQFALISALCIGRDHMGDTAIQSGYVSDDQSFDRFLHIGSTGIWLILPEDFAGMLCEADVSLAEWFTTFERCAMASGYDLCEF